MKYQRFWAGNTIPQWADIAERRYGGLHEALGFMSSERNDINMTSIQGREFARRVIDELARRIQKRRAE